MNNATDWLWLALVCVAGAAYTWALFIIGAFKPGEDSDYE
jgi:hypothetical protein